MKRARVNTLRKRLILLDTLAKSGCTHGVEVWGWQKRQEMERMESKIVKMALGVNRNTPDYIWRLEAGRRSLEIETRRRAASYIGKILDMEEGRWPKICLQEEMRKLLNKNASQWGKDFEESLLDNR